MASTLRNDSWWVGPIAVLLGLTVAVIYITWAAFQGTNYWVGTGEGFGGYLSPLYSPLFYIKEGIRGGAPLSHALFEGWPGWWPEFMPASPAFFILIFPGLFRFTCYYYRKAYYRAFTWTPPTCAVGALQRGGKGYAGETGLMIFQNLHRYAMYIAVIFIFILSYDAIMAFFQNDKFGVGVGSIVLILNVVFLGGYTFGCHSFRHIIGGRKDCFNCAQRSHITWSWSSILNGKHQLFAWCSLFWVCFTDFYVRMVASGAIIDLNTWG